MSLAEAVLGVAERMEKFAEGLYEDVTSQSRSCLVSFVSELRTAVKASEGEKGNLGLVPSLQQVLDSLQTRGNKTKEDRLQKEIKERAAQEEVSGESMVELVGGPLAGDYVPIPSGMPVEAKTNIAGFVYQLKGDRKLYHVLPKLILDEK